MGIEIYRYLKLFVLALTLVKCLTYQQIYWFYVESD